VRKGWHQDPRSDFQATSNSPHYRLENIREGVVLANGRGTGQCEIGETGCRDEATSAIVYVWRSTHFTENKVIRVGALSIAQKREIGAGQNAEVLYRRRSRLMRLQSHSCGRQQPLCSVSILRIRERATQDTQYHPDAHKSHSHFEQTCSPHSGAATSSLTSRHHGRLLGRMGRGRCGAPWNQWSAGRPQKICR